MKKVLKRSMVSMTVAGSLLSACIPHQDEPINNRTNSSNNRPRGVDIDAIAANCSFQELGYLTKARSYNNLCGSLTEAEYCLAYIKAHMNTKYELKESRSKDRANRCLKVFSKGLGIEQ